MYIVRPCRLGVHLFVAILLLSCLNAWAQGIPGIKLAKPKDTVELEHHDRIHRLSKLSRYKGLLPPQFLEYEVPADQHGLSDFPIPMPLLRVIYRDTVFFDFGKADLKPGARVILDTIAESLRAEPPDVTLFVAGHTDYIGSAESNLNLGFARAETVAKVLAGIGVNRSQVFRISFGKSMPIDTNATEDGRAHNRRVEFLFAARPEPIAAWLARQPVPACSANRSGGGNDCPGRFIARSVHRPPKLESPSANQPPVSIALRQDKTRDIDTREKVKDVDPGEKIVEIDPRSQIFVIRAPE